MIRIAIVEDDTGYRSQLGKYIDQYQSDFSETVSVSEFSDGLEIVEKYKSEYDIILMDIQMKHMDGMQAAMRIRDMDKNVIIIFITNHNAILDGVAVEDYLTLNGTKMWLVKNNTTLAEGKVSSYAGKPMFWSEQYQTYCYLVIAETLSDEEAKAEIGIMDGEKVIINNGNNMDVNGTGILDASDAQLVYNMYNAVYNEFTSDVTMEKFLRADANGDNKVDVKDAEVIINKILSGKAN